MSLRMERPDQYEEQWKEEPESVKTGDTRTAPRSALRRVLHLRSEVHYLLSSIERGLHPVQHFQKADQGGSERRRTKLSDQDEEERKGGPESVKTGDTRTAPRITLRLRSVNLFSMEEVPHPAHHDIHLEKADQRESETRRTKFSDQDKEEREEEPESGRAGDTWTGPRSVLRKPRALRSAVTLLRGENLSTAFDDIDNDIVFHIDNDIVFHQHRSETRRTESSAWGHGPFSPKTHDCDFPDQPRTSKSKTKRRKSAPEYACNVFRTWSAAAVWIMMALTVATSSLAGAKCIGTEVKLDKGEAALRCPLPVNASATRQGIIIKHFPTPDSADEVLFCYWPEEADEPKCESSDSFSLVPPLTDQVVAKVPMSRLMDSGAYKCQLYPLGDHKYFTPCHIHHSSDNDEGSAVVPTTVVSSIASNGSTPDQDPLITEAPPCVRQCGSVALIEAVLALQVIIIILLVVSVLYLENRKNRQQPVTSEEEPMNSLDEAGVMPEPTLYPRLPSHCTPEKLQPFLSQSCSLAAVGGLMGSAVGQAVLRAPTSGSSLSWSTL